MANDKTYSQDELNNIIEGVKARYQKEKNDAKDKEIEELKAFKSQVEQEQAEAKVMPAIQTAFKEAGGNERAFNSFYSTNKNSIKTGNDDDIKSSINSLKEKQDWFFNGDSPSPQPTGDDDGKISKKKQKFENGSIYPVE